jgi:NADPH-dependent ferric siderophore reductase
MSTPYLLNAETRVALASPQHVLDQLREHFAEHGDVTGNATSFGAHFDIGSAAARLEPGCIVFHVGADDDTSLAFMQWSVAEHVHEYAEGELPEVVWRGGTSVGSALPYFREMTVVGTREITPRMRRVTLRGRDLERFARKGMHVRLLLPPRPGVRPVWPVMAADGRQQWPDGERPIHRVYTLRRIDVSAGEVDIDFVLHDDDHTPGADFALEARRGMVVGMTGPGGGDLPEASSYVFAGDETALPAIARMLEELPANVSTRVVIEISDEGERQPLDSPARMDLRWLLRDGRPAGDDSPLPDALRLLAAENAGDTFFWVACEQAPAKAIRRHLKSELRLPRGRFLVAAYWKRGVSGEPVDDHDD